MVFCMCSPRIASPLVTQVKSGGDSGRRSKTLDSCNVFCNRSRNVVLLGDLAFAEFEEREEEVDGEMEEEREEMEEEREEDRRG